MARVIHFDIAAADTARAISFYRHAFGWKISKAPGPLEYWLVRTGRKTSRASMAGSPAAMPNGSASPCSSKWTWLEAAAHRIVEAGGSIVQPRTVIPGVGYVVGCRDTEDNIFAIIEPDRDRRLLGGSKTRVRAKETERHAGHVPLRR